MQEQKSIASVIDFKGIFGFVPGKDDKRWEELEKEAEERIARGGGIVQPKRQGEAKERQAEPEQP